ncbi:hypothetical protein [Actinoplanes awajinensis]|uniref:Uncharacterized protein n=1 Tax=Actinoplanes awajinensis subsp. mycoplanecinus TaxID=135947 RepID=A0A101JMA4_9ACTN|nr:hypothetical protein [Actinoplanes awajinensis]KUL29505.1 hypothetical protein ADL15_27395 [Actinoplanes awajinensis subsp. mycoplanecinus]
MTTLEDRYRRLLRIYPAAHRAAYAEEMIGVLLAGSPPGRRFPAPADALDLVRAGLTARLGHAFPPLSGTTWRAAAGVTALITALVMATYSAADFILGVLVRQLWVPMPTFYSPGDLEPGVRAAAWFAVCVAALLGRRRAAVWLSGVVVLVELGKLVFWVDRVPWTTVRVAWEPCTAILVGAAFAAARRMPPVRTVIGKPGLWLLALAALSVLGSPLTREFTLAQELFTDGLPSVLLAGAVAALDPPVRRQVVMLCAATLVVPLAALSGWDSLVPPGPTSGVPETVALSAVVRSLAPVVFLAAGVLVLWGGERFGVRGRGQVKGHE